ncbi:ALP1-like protein isoform X1 [Tanacetum coccineum]
MARSIFEGLRKLTSKNSTLFMRKKHGFPGMIDSIDCTKWLWAQWSNNDVNVLRQSPVLNDLKVGKAPEVPFVANDVTYKWGYYLTDGIYPEWAVLMKSISQPGSNDVKRIRYKQAHEAARKDVKRVFGVLKKKWAIVAVDVFESVGWNSRNRTSKSPSGSSKGSDCSNEGISSRCSKSEHRDPSSKTGVFDPLSSDKNGELHNSMLNLSLSSKSNADKDAYLLPEFDDLMKEFDITSIKANIDLSEAESPPKGQSRVIKETQEQEINNLQSTVKRLKERERGLKAQLLEYSRLKEQETTVRELQSRLKLNSMESKLLTLKVESLTT